jgi:hypothetical protein
MQPTLTSLKKLLDETSVTYKAHNQQPYSSEYYNIRTQKKKLGAF